MNIKIFEANMNDLNDDLINLYIEGYNIHKRSRKDIFSDKTNEELKERLISQLESDIEKFLVIKVDDKILGYLSYKINEKSIKTVWVDEFIIDEKERKKGYGRLLINELRNICKKNNVKRIDLNCWSFNKEAIKFYEKLNFKEQRIIFEDIID